MDSLLSAWEPCNSDGDCGLRRSDACSQAFRIVEFSFCERGRRRSLAMSLISVLGPPEAQIGMLGALVSVLAGLVFSYVEQDEVRERRQTELLTQLSVPVVLAADRELYDQYLGF